MGWDGILHLAFLGGLLSVVVRICRPLTMWLPRVSTQCIAGLGTACISGWQI